MPTRVNIHEAKTNLSKLIRRAEAGEEIIICRRHKPVARIAPLEKGRRYRPPPARSLGVRPGVNLDKALQLAGEMEDEEIIRKMRLGK